jgi:membrane associated rhomboid family serine protease
MARWFEDKFDSNKIRKYTRRNIRPSHFEKISRKFSVTNWLIFINVLVFILTFILILIFGEAKVYSWVALQPIGLFNGAVWTLLTSMFVHFLFGHILANMVTLSFIGNFAEKIIGRKRFFWLYMISGIFAGLFFAGLSILFGNSAIGSRIFSDPSIYAVGASGAIFSLLGVLAVLTPKGKVYLIAGPIIAIVIGTVFDSLYPNSPYSSMVSLLIAFYFIFAIFAMLSFNPKLSKIAVPFETTFSMLPIYAIVPLTVISLFLPLPIGNMAHLGGLIAGLIYGFYLKSKYRQKTQMINKYFSR